MQTRIVEEQTRDQLESLDLNHAATRNLDRAVRDRLIQSPYRALHYVVCDVRGGTVTLTGNVRSYFLKQMAQHLVCDLRGIDRVRNELSVA
jgi:osmotically-inducible protein OsmY